MALRRRIYLARHGDAAYFESDGTGASDDPPLTERGVAEAEALAAFLSNADLDLVISTGLRRTAQTAELALGVRTLPIQVLPGLSEAKSGNFEDVETEEEMRVLITRAFDGAEAPGARFLTGETFSGVWDRATAAWVSLLQRDDWQCALVCCHGVINRTILAHSLGTGPEVYRSIEQDSGCVNVLDVEGAGSEARVECVRLMNFTPYDASKDGLRSTALEALWAQFTGA